MHRTAIPPRTVAPTSIVRTKDALLYCVAIFVLGAVLWAVYGRALNSPCIYDDAESIIHNPSIVRLWPFIGNAEQPGPLNPPRDLPTSGRPLVNLSLALNYRFGELNPVGYHVFNLIVHLLTTLLFTLVVQRILRLDCFGGRFNSASGSLAFLTALLWAVHPLNTETVVYITQRTELMVGFFYMATLYYSLRYWQSATSVEKRWWLILATSACLAGMACKEVMVTAPVLMLLFERTFIARSFRQALRQSWPLYCGLACGWVLLMLLNYRQPRGASAGFGLELTPFIWWFTQAKVLWLYLKLAVWPWPLAIHYGLPYLTFATAWPWVLATVLLVIGLLALLWQRRTAGYAGAWVLLILSPTLIVPIVTEVMAERRMYLPLMALVALAAGGGYRLLQMASKKSVARAVMAGAGTALALLWSLMNVHRLSAYHDALALWQDTAASQPNDSVAYNNWGLELMNVGRVREAIPCYQQGLQLNPQHLEARANLGTALMKIGRLPEAIEQFQQVLQHHPDSAAVLCDLGIALGKAGQTEAAIQQLQRARHIDPNNAAVHYNLGIAFGNAEHMSQACDEFEQAVRIDPNDFPARFHLGMALAASNRTPQALEQFQRLLQTKPSDCEVYFNLALVYAQLNQSTMAVDTAKKAAQLARSQQRTELAQEFDAWLKDYQEDLSSPHSLSSRDTSPLLNR